MVAISLTKGQLGSKDFSLQGTLYVTVCGIVESNPENEAEMNKHENNLREMSLDDRLGLFKWLELSKSSTVGSEEYEQSGLHQRAIKRYYQNVLM